MLIVPANESDHNHFLSVIQKGIKNVGKERIKLIIADRGFLNGPQMWVLKHVMKIDFIIPARSGMIVREDAIKLRSIYEKEGKNSAQWPYGKGNCSGYGVEKLLSYKDYNPEGIPNNRNTNGSPINAVVVTTWRGNPVQPGKEAVLLTSLPVNGDAAIVPKGYRLRSLIENCGFRELKQAAYLNKIPSRGGENAEQAAYLHIMLCVFAHTLFYAFLGWRKKKAPSQADGDCMRQWRRKKAIESSENDILIFAGNGRYYAFFKLNEVLDILDVKQLCRIQYRRSRRR